MRNISFALTTEQVHNQSKTVTRRLRWADLKVGTLLQPIEKGQGLKKGETVRKIGGPIRVVAVHRECLERLEAESIYGQAECVREGFPGLSPMEFVTMFMAHNGCKPNAIVTRIEFEYVRDEER
jgi:hypothetical protein